MKNAIIIRGQARTWNYIKKYTLENFNHLYPNSDWFFVTENTGTVTEDSIKNDFKDLNLVATKFLDVQDYYIPKTYGEQKNFGDMCLNNHSYWKPAWFDHAAGILKREHELITGTKYYSVLFLRPDVHYYVDNKNKEHYPIEPFEVRGAFPNEDKSTSEQITPDFYCRAGSVASNIFTMKYLDTSYSNGNLDQLYSSNTFFSLGRYILGNFLNGKNSEFGTPIIGVPGTPIPAIIRPNNIDISNTFEEHLSKYDLREWTILSKKEKIQICEKANISPKDYVTQIDTSGD